MGSAPLDDRYDTGATPGEGTFFCLVCGSQLAMQETDRLPDCPGCGGSKYRRDSIFKSRQDHGQATGEFPAPTPATPPDWVPKTREALAESARCLAFQDDEGQVRTFAIERGWTRIGRSPNADLRLDDPSVSRRHALIVAEPGKPLRVLDDRSLNGVFVNGEKIEWGPLGDGDELAIGRYKLYLLQG
jgi:predicted  nucleic acid-binding Zn-ribbon protein